MDWTLIFIAIRTVATAVSTITAIRAGNESKGILEQIEEEHSRDIESKGSIRVSSGGNNSDVLVGNSSRDIYKRQEMTTRQIIVEAIKNWL